MSSSMRRPTISSSDVEESEYSGSGFRRVVTSRCNFGALGTALAFGGAFGAALPFGRPRGLLTGTSSMASTISSGGGSASSSAGGGSGGGGGGRPMAIEVEPKQPEKRNAAIAPIEDRKNKKTRNLPDIPIPLPDRSGQAKRKPEIPKEAPPPDDSQISALARKIGQMVKDKRRKGMVAQIIDTGPPLPPPPLPPPFDPP